MEETENNAATYINIDSREKKTRFRLNKLKIKNVPEF